MNVMTTRCDGDRLRRRRTAPVAVNKFALPLILASCSGGEASDNTAATDAHRDHRARRTTDPAAHIDTRTGPFDHADRVYPL